MKRFLFITGLSLCIYLIIGCGTGRDGEELPLPPTPPTPVDTVITEPPVEVADSVNIAEWSEIWLGYVQLLENMECLNLKFRKSYMNDIDSEELRGNLVGTWKLLLDHRNVDYGDNLYSKDCSCRSVLYIFDADSMLTVLSDTTEFTSGLFKYTFSGNNLGCIPIDYVQPELSIGGEKLYCQVADEMMLIKSVDYVDEDIEKPIIGRKRRLFFKIKE